MRLCMKTDQNFDKILWTNMNFFMEHVEIDGREVLLWIEDDQV